MTKFEIQKKINNSKFYYRYFIVNSECVLDRLKEIIENNTVWEKQISNCFDFDVEFAKTDFNGRITSIIFGKKRPDDLQHWKKSGNGYFPKKNTNKGKEYLNKINSIISRVDPIESFKCLDLGNISYKSWMMRNDCIHTINIEWSYDKNGSLICILELPWVDLEESIFIESKKNIDVKDSNIEFILGFKVSGCMKEIGKKKCESLINNNF